MKKYLAFLISIFFLSNICAQTPKVTFIDILNGDHIKTGDPINLFVFIDGDFNIGDGNDYYNWKYDLGIFHNEIDNLFNFYDFRGIYLFNENPSGTLKCPAQIYPFKPDDFSHEFNTFPLSDISLFDIHNRMHGLGINSGLQVIYYSLPPGSNEYFVRYRIANSPEDYDTYEYGQIWDGKEKSYSQKFVIGDYPSLLKRTYTEGGIQAWKFKTVKYPEPAEIEDSSPFILYNTSLKENWEDYDRIVSARMVIHGYDIDDPQEALLQTAYGVPIGYLTETRNGQWGYSTIEIPPKYLVESEIDNFKLINTKSLGKYKIDSVILLVECIQSGTEDLSVEGGWQPDPSTFSKFNGEAFTSSTGTYVNGTYFNWNFSLTPSASDYIGQLKAVRLTITAKDIDFEEAEIVINDHVIGFAPSTGSNMVRTYQIGIPEDSLYLINTSLINNLKIRTTGIGAGKYTIYHVGLAYDYKVNTGPVAQISKVISPVSGSSNNPKNSDIIFQFNKDINPTTLTNSTIIVKDQSGNPFQSSNITYDKESFTVTYNPDNDLTAGARIDVRVTTEVIDTYGNPLGAGTTWSFYTSSDPDVTSPQVSSVQPANGSTNLELTGQTFTVTFNESVNPATLVYPDIYLYGYKRSDEYPIAITWNSTRSTATISTPSFFQSDERLLLHLGTGIKDDSGNPLNEVYNYEYYTSDYDPPAVPAGIHTVPGDKSITISWNANSEDDLSGYYVYSKLSDGTYSRINSTPITTTSYNLLSLNNFAHYYLKVSAIDINGNESNLSSYIEEIPYKPGPNNISGIYSYNMTLVKEGAPYYVTGDFTVRNNSVLTIEDNVTITFNSYSYQIFTTESDFIASNVTFINNSSNPTYLSLGKKAVITNCDFDKVYINSQDASLELTNNTFNNVTFPSPINLFLQQPAVQPVISDITFGSNVTYPGISIENGGLPSSGLKTAFILENLGYDYYILNDFAISSTGSLTMEPGITVNMRGDNALNFYNYGLLNADGVTFNGISTDNSLLNLFGTSTLQNCNLNKVRVESYDDNLNVTSTLFDNLTFPSPINLFLQQPAVQPVISDITFGSNVTYPGISIENSGLPSSGLKTAFILENLGYDYYILNDFAISSTGNITMEQGITVNMRGDNALDFYNYGFLYIDGVSFNGISSDNSLLSLHGTSAIQNCDLNNVKIESYDDNLTITGTSFDNITFPSPINLFLQQPAVQPVISDITFGPNITYPGISIENSGLPSSGLKTAYILENVGYDYYVLNDIAISSTGSLTIEPGITVYMRGSTALNFYNYGLLNANGVSFRGISLSTSIFDCRGTEVINNCKFEKVQLKVLNSASFRVENSRFKDIITAIDINNPASCLIMNNEFLSNDYGIKNSGTVPINATENYWNHETGPFHIVTNPDGQGLSVSDNIVFDPWLPVPPFSPFKISSLPDQLLEEGFPDFYACDDLNSIFDDKNSDDLIFDYNISNPIVSIDLQNDKIKLSSIQYLFGTSQAILSARDDFWNATDTFNISVADINSPPLIEDAIFNLDEKSAAGTFVGQINATDPDYGQVLTYSIISGNTDNAFTIDQNTGIITVSNSLPLDYSINPVFNLLIRATDNGTPPIAAQKDAVIYLNLLTLIDLNGLNTKAPVIFPNPFNAYFFIQGVNSLKEPYSIEIFDAMGKTVLKKSYRTNPGQWEIELSCGFMSKGVYLLYVKTKTKIWAYRIIKI